ncbi:MAG TPA: prepilin-type N-terminal cleavage/methylation domain-containing protein [Gemmatimonadaceae bacterium]|nr:prepilin-type N-terminal cleavage/methylation domain-containing protein [Gemmatimonadaceae bacterium]
MRRLDGFTLIEVLVALLVGAMVLAGVRAVLEALGDSSEIAEAATASMDRRATGEDLLRRLAERLDNATPGATPFVGTQRVTQFSSWCEVPRGWLERCTIVLAFDTIGSGPALVARIGDSIRIPLVTGFAQGSFRYLESADNGGAWERVWGRGVGAPLAIVVIVDRDTVIVPVGERG